MSALGKMINATVRCVVCGAKLGECDCWAKCECGWSYRKGGTCNNPVHGGDGRLGIVAMTPRKKRRSRKGAC